MWWPGKKRKHNEDFLQFGPYLIDLNRATQHFLMVGAPGSGKTVTIRVLLSSIFRSGLRFRACVYDPKGELLPVLYALDEADDTSIRSGRSRIKSLNPFDTRSYAWNLGADIKSPSLAIQLSTILISDGKNSGEGTQFFIDAARDLFASCVLVLVASGKSWSLRDILQLALNEDYMRAAFRAVEESANPIGQVTRVREAYVECDPRTSSNIRATLSTALASFEPVAACWDRAANEGRELSLTEWASDNCADVLVLGNVESSRATVDAVNQALFRRMAELSLARREQTVEERSNGDNITWYFLDELREAGGLEIGSLSLRGRSRGCALVVAVQTLDGLSDVYGEFKARELISEFGNGAFLRVMEPTAKQVAELFGSGPRKVRSHGLSLSESNSLSINTSTEIRPLLFSEDLLYIDPPSKTHGVSGYFRLAGFNPESKEDLFDTFRPEFFDEKDEGDLSPWRAGFIPRPIEHEYLKPWTQSDWTRLGFPGELPTRSSNGGKTVSEMMQDFLDSKEPEE